MLNRHCRQAGKNLSNMFFWSCCKRKRGTVNTKLTSFMYVACFTYTCVQKFFLSNVRVFAARMSTKWGHWNTRIASSFVSNRVGSQLRVLMSWFVTFLEAFALLRCHTNRCLNCISKLMPRRKEDVHSTMSSLYTDSLNDIDRAKRKLELFL